MSIDFLLSVVPETVTWSTKTCSIMILSNLVCIAFGRYAIKVKPQGPSLPLKGSLSDFGLPEFVASTSLGHIVGCGSILGLGYLGLLR